MYKPTITKKAISEKEFEKILSKSITSVHKKAVVKAKKNNAAIVIAKDGYVVQINPDNTEIKVKKIRAVSSTMIIKKGIKKRT